MWCVYTHTHTQLMYYSVIKTYEMPFVATWMDPEIKVRKKKINTT